MTKLRINNLLLVLFTAFMLGGSLTTGIYAMSAAGSHTGLFDDDEDEGTTCVICLDEFTKDSIVIQLDCGNSSDNGNHSFHLDCIDRQAGAILHRQSESKKECPICRAKIKPFDPRINKPRASASRPQQNSRAGRNSRNGRRGRNGRTNPFRRPQTPHVSSQSSHQGPTYIHHRLAPLSQSEQTKLNTLIRKIGNNVSDKTAPDHAIRKCSTCHEDVSTKNVSLLLTCGHRFCLKDAGRLVEQGRKTCPKCNTALKMFDPLKLQGAATTLFYMGRVPTKEETHQINTLRSYEHMQLAQNHIPQGQRAPIKKVAASRPAPVDVNPNVIPEEFLQNLTKQNGSL